MAQLNDTVITGSLAVSNCIYGSVTCATTTTNACKGWNGSTFASFGSNAFNSNSYLLATGCAVDSNKLNGFIASASSTANTVVVRDANQYIYGAYFNSNISDENINSYANSPAIMFSSGDKWIRRTTKANLQTWLGLGSNAYNSTAFTTCTGTVTSIAFQCAGTAKSTITSSGTINLSANAWNTYATISTSTYPGACCTGNMSIVTGTCGTVSFWYNTTTHNGGVSFRGTPTKINFFDAVCRALNCSYGITVISSATSAYVFAVSLTGTIWDALGGAKEPAVGMNIDSSAAIRIYENTNEYKIQLHRNDGGNINWVNGDIRW